MNTLTKLGLDVFAKYKCTALKRDGSEEPVKTEKIKELLVNLADTACKEYPELKVVKEETIDNVYQDCIDKVIRTLLDNVDHVEEKLFCKTADIEKFLLNALDKHKLTPLKDVYLGFKSRRDDKRMLGTDLMKKVGKITVTTDRDNANVGNNFSAKLLRIASETCKTFNLASMPSKFSKPHIDGSYHIHDLDSYRLTSNCLVIDLEKALRNGFNTGYGTINRPNRIESATAVACILLQSSQNDLFGGQGFSDFDNALAPYVELTRQETIKERKNMLETLGVTAYDETIFNKEVEKQVEKKVHQAMQGFTYNLNTMHSRAGSQVPFSSVNIGLPKSKDAELVCRAFLEEYDKGLGKSEQPIFPNIIFRVKKGVNLNKEDKYYELYKLACNVSANRMNPTFRLLDSKLDLPYYEQGIDVDTMGCRTDLLNNRNGDKGAKGRGNIAPVSINLPRIAIESNKDLDVFFAKLDHMLDLSRDELMERYNVLKQLKVKDLPFAIGQGFMKGGENLKDTDSIEPVLIQGTWTIGFIGLAETLISLTGKHHGESKESWELGYRILQHMKDKIDRYSDEENLNFSLYATPAEGLSGRFVAIDKEKYGIIEGVTDKDYYTNSFHIPVGYNISALEKAKLEGKFHTLCTGGHITYIEIDGGDLETKSNYIERVIKYCVENNTEMSYIAFNFRIRYCKDCGKRIDDINVDKCPVCGSQDIQGISRVTGYLSLDERFSPGKVAERADRVKHELK